MKRNFLDFKISVPHVIALIPHGIRIYTFNVPICINIKRGLHNSMLLFSYSNSKKKKSIAA